MQQKRKRSKTTIIIAVAAVVLMIVLMIFWRRYESKHKAELKASVLTTDTSNQSTPSEVDYSESEAAKPKRVIPDDPEKLLAMVEEAFKDEGYFETQDTIKGMHVYFLLKKCLTCNGEPGKVEVMAKRLKQLSDQGYGPWRVDSEILADLDEKIAAAKQM